MRWPWSKKPYAFEAGEPMFVDAELTPFARHTAEGVVEPVVADASERALAMAAQSVAVTLDGEAILVVVLPAYPRPLARELDERWSALETTVRQRTAPTALLLHGQAELESDGTVAVARFGGLDAPRAAAVGAAIHRSWAWGGERYVAVVDGERFDVRMTVADGRVAIDVAPLV